MDSLQALEMLRKQTCALASWYMKVFSPMPKRSCYKLVVRATVYIVILLPWSCSISRFLSFGTRLRHVGLYKLKTNVLGTPLGM